MGLFSLIFKRGGEAANAVVNCSPDSPRGRHGEVLTGLGMMGDAKLCLRCGMESYDDSGTMFYFRESQRHVKAPEDWPAIAAARELREDD